MYVQRTKWFCAGSLDLKFLCILKLFCEDVPCNKLNGSTNFIFFKPTNQMLWVLEVYSRSLCKVGMCQSRWRRVDHMCKFFGARRSRKNLRGANLEHMHAVHSLTDYELRPFFCNFWHFVILFWIMKNGPGILEEWVYNTPIFWTVPLHLEVWNLPFVMELGDFIVFNLKIAKFRIYMDLHIHHWDFYFMKKCNHKKFHRICNGNILYPSLV